VPKELWNSTLARKLFLEFRVAIKPTLMASAV
jgi:hypothetical protein